MAEQTRTVAGIMCVLATTVFLMTAGTASATVEQRSAPQPAAGHPQIAHPPLSKKRAAAEPQTVVDINSASRAELKTLPGIGDAEADRIIAGRPWLTKIDLTTRNVLPMGVYVALKERIIARQDGKLKPKK